MAERAQTLSETRPTPRRGLSRVEAAARLGVTSEQFDVLTRDGRIPPPRLIDGHKIWDAQELMVGRRVFSKPPASHPSAVYVIGFDQYVKIGFSTDAPSRIRALQDGVPIALKIHAVLRGTQKDERNLHRRFESYRARGEWFRLEGELKLWIESGCKP